MTSNSHHSPDVTLVVSSLQGIASAVVRAGQHGNLNAVLQEIAHVARQLIRTRYAALGIPDGSGGFRHFLVSGLSEAEFAQIPHPPLGRGLLGVIMNERKPLRLESIQTDPRSSGFPPNHPPMHTLLGVPIQVGAYLFGLLYLSDKIDGTQFTDEDQLLVETLAGYASLAIAGVQLSEQQSRVSVLEERERIGMELHDSVIQSLYAIGMELQLMKSDAAPLLDLDSPIRHLDNVIGEIRQYILNLKASTSHRTTIRDSITAVFERLHIPPHLHVIIDAPDEYPPLESHTFEAACQICSEVASNAIRHANATELYVAARKERSAFVMIIKDNGSGFDVNAVEKGLGLTNIMRRAQLLSGNVSIRSFPGEGTQITLTLPLG